MRVTFLKWGCYNRSKRWHPSRYVLLQERFESRCREWKAGIWQKFIPTWYRFQAKMLNAHSDLVERVSCGTNYFLNVTPKNGWMIVIWVESGWFYKETVLLIKYRNIRSKPFTSFKIPAFLVTNPDYDRWEKMMRHLKEQKAFPSF